MEPLEEGFGPERWSALDAAERERLRAWFKVQVDGIIADGRPHDGATIRKRLKQAMEAEPEIMELFIKQGIESALLAAALKIEFPSKEG